MTTNDTPPAWATFTNDDMHAAGLETVAAEMERDAARRECARLRAQVADLADKLHKANAEIDSLTKAGNAWASENERLKAELATAHAKFAVLVSNPAVIR